MALYNRGAEVHTTCLTAAAGTVMDHRNCFLFITVIIVLISWGAAKHRSGHLETLHGH